MLNFLNKYNLIKGTECWGVEIIFTSKDSYTLIAVELISNKEGIKINRRFNDISFEELAKINTKNSPIYLSINGRGIIYKKIKPIDATNNQQLLNQVLPNATVKDFYIQQSTSLDNDIWAAVIRKDLLDDLLSLIEKVKLFTLQVYIGPFIIETISSLVGKDSLCTLSNELMFSENKISHIDSLGDIAAGNEYEIEGEIINSHELIAFASAFSHYIPSMDIKPISSIKVIGLSQEYLHKKKCSVVALTVACFLLLVTVSNLLIQNSIESSYNKYQFQAQSKKEYVKELSFLKNELATKEQFIQNSGVAKASKTSYYADQIALSVPSSIQLEEMFINPIKKKINKAEDIQFNYNTIKVSGSVNQSIELNNWIKTLRNYSWTNDVNIILFNQENLKTPGQFEILIKINS